MSAVAECHRGDWEDIGHGVRMRRAFIDGELRGLDYEHPPSGACNGKDFYIPVGPPGSHTAQHHWTLNQAEPVTISPSLLCPVCKHHGFIQNGKWVPC